MGQVSSGRRQIRKHNTRSILPLADFAVEEERGDGVLLDLDRAAGEGPGAGVAVEAIERVVCPFYFEE